MTMPHQPKTVSPTIDRIVHVPLREAWPHEARDFSSWLFQNIDLLSEVVEMKLEATEAEVRVGGFSLDVLAIDTETGNKVVIENQIETTDHKHLGQLITYCAGLSADIAIWISKNFRDEHRNALDWLNQQTGIDTQFFGVEVEAIRIGNSNPACHFKLVSFPNDWQKVASRIAEIQRSEAQSARQPFLNEITRRMTEEYQFTPVGRTEKQKVRSFESGIPGLTYAVAFGEEGIRVELWIATASKEENKRLFSVLQTDTKAIEDAIGSEIRWTRMDNRKASRVAVFRSIQPEPFDPEDTDLLTWATDLLIRFRIVFGPRLQTLSPD